MQTITERLVFLNFFETFWNPVSSIPHLFGHQVLPHSKHLGTDVGCESIHLLAVLLHLLSIQHTLQSAGLLRKLEQSLPLILRQRLLLGSSTLGVLSLALGLPLCDLGLFTAKLSLVVLEVVEVGVVRLDALEEEIAGLLEEGVDRKVEVVDRGVQRGLESVAVEVIKRCGLLDGALGGGGGDLVKERCEEVRVVDADRDLVEDILEGELGLLQASLC
jgi:hypothetical protein